LSLTIRGVGGGPQLAEAHVLAYGERTVAIAAPSPIAGEWVVLAVTPLDSEAARERIARLEDGGATAGADPGEKVHRVEGGVTPPVLLERVSPKHPVSARDEKRMGKVILEAVIDVEGRVRAINVLRVPSGGEDLVAAATSAIEQWRYKPAELHGKPVAVFFTMVVQFKLE
jgi:TonB family protein